VVVSCLVRYFIHIEQQITLASGYVLLNEDDLTMPPDFSFGDKVEVFVTTNKLKSLKEWNVKLPQCLFKVFTELKHHYNVCNPSSEKATSLTILIGLST